MYKANILSPPPDNLISGVTIGYQAPGGKNYFCAPTNKHCRIWSKK